MRRDVSRPQLVLWREVLPQDGRRRAQAQLIRQEALNSVMGKTVVKIHSSGDTVGQPVLRARS
jgi:hypothetical protein